MQNKVLPNTKMINLYLSSELFNEIIEVLFVIIAGVCIIIWIEMYISDYRQRKRDKLAQEEYQKVQD